MNDVYGKVADWRDLVPRERDVITGKRTSQRDDKRREDDTRQNSSTHSSSGVGPTGAASSWSLPTVLALVAVAAVLLGVGALAATRALDGGSNDRLGPAANPGGSISSAPGTTNSGSAASASTPATAAATAITLSYSGGRLTKDTCTDATGGGACSPLDTSFDPLTVRCTATGCTLHYFGGSGPIAQALTVTGQTDEATEGCQETTWKATFRPIGTATTEGIRHPARIVGTAETNRIAEATPTVNCLGASETYAYDATPS